MSSAGSSIQHPISCAHNLLDTKRSLNILHPAKRKFLSIDSKTHLIGMKRTQKVEMKCLVGKIGPGFLEHSPFVKGKTKCTQTDPGRYGFDFGSSAHAPRLRG